MRLLERSAVKALLGLYSLVLIVFSFVYFSRSFAVGITLVVIGILTRDVIVDFRFRRLTSQISAVKDLIPKLASINLRRQHDLQSLQQLSGPHLPLPHFTRWTIGTDLAVYLTDWIITNRPQVIVEASSGLSSLVLGYATKKVGDGKVYSLEHKEEYWTETNNQVALHRLGVFVHPLLAPLKAALIGGKERLWYDTGSLFQELPGPIDLLLVDGPLTKGTPEARFPALPVLMTRLSPSCMIVLDDGDRDEERRVVQMWKAIAPNLQVQQLASFEKSPYLLQFR